MALDRRRMTQVVTVEPLKALSLRLAFDDGVTKVVDLAPILGHGGPMVDPLLHDRTFFEAVRIENGTVVWPNGFDLDPDVLYYEDLLPVTRSDEMASETSRK